MKRRNFLKTLAGLPFVGLLKSGKKNVLGKSLSSDCTFGDNTRSARMDGEKIIVSCLQEENALLKDMPFLTHNGDDMNGFKVFINL